MVLCTFWKDQFAVWILEWSGQRGGRQGECLGAAAGTEAKRVARMSEVDSEMDRGGQMARDRRGRGGDGSRVISASGRSS